MFQAEYSREALKTGLLLERKLGVNPFKFGMIGSTDAHTGLTAVEEENFFGKHSGVEPGPHRWEHIVIESPDPKYTVKGWQQAAAGYAVRALAESVPVASSWHAQAELLCTFPRAFRECRLNREAYQTQRSQFSSDQSASAFNWLPVTEATLSHLDRVLAKAPDTTFLRAADALHPACAAEHGYSEVYSNDRHFLAAAPLFGLKGINIIADSSS